MDMERKRALLIRMLKKHYDIEKCTKRFCIMAKRADFVYCREMCHDAACVIGVKFDEEIAKVEVEGKPIITYDLSEECDDYSVLMSSIWVDRFGEKK